MSAKADWYRTETQLLRELHRGGKSVRADRDPEGMAVQADGVRGAQSHRAVWTHTPEIDGYEHLEELGCGGQGIVYSALQRSTQRTVAIKVLLAGAWAPDKHKRRFEREVKLVASLRHPSIVRVYDSGLTSEGHPYYVMELIDGVGLDELIGAVSERQPWILSGYEELVVIRGRGSDRRVASGFAPRPALELMAKVCEAVGHAHEHGLIHRDLKPSNIRVDTHAEPHVLDFGLAKQILGEAATAVGTQTSLTGEFMGSLAWASPEQTEGLPDSIDARSDVYSLGVILFQMLTGQFPYPVVGGFRQVLDRIKNTEPPRPSALRKDLDDEVDTIVLKCLVKEPDQRYADGAALTRDIRRYLAGEPIEAKRASVTYRLRKRLWRHRVTVLLSAALILVTAIGAAGSFWMWRSGYWSDTPAAPVASSTTATGGGQDENGVWHINEFARLQPADISSNDLFGEFTAIAAEPDWRILVSATRQQDVGAVFVYRFDGANWVQEAKLLGSADAERGGFGYGLRIDGRTAMIGGKGGFSIFEYDGSEWSSRGKLQLPGQHLGGFCSAQAKRAATAQQEDNGDLVVSCYRREANGTPDNYADDNWVEESRFRTPAGVMRVARAQWTTEQALLVADNGCDAGNRGCESGIRGSVRIFRQDSRAPEGWCLEAVLTGHDTQPVDSFGCPVATEGNVVMVGAPYREDYGRKTGAVYVFRNDGQRWLEEAKLLPPGGVGDVLFGWSLAVSGDLLLVGAQTDSEGAYYAGAVHVYQFDGAKWTEKAKLVASEPRALETLGGSVSLAADTAVIGAASYMDPAMGGVDLGAAYVFRGLADRNGNGELDMIDIASGTSRDRNHNRVPDECEPFPTTLSQNTTGYDDDIVLGPPDDRWYEFHTGIVEFDFADARVADGDGPDFNVYEFENGVPEFNLIRVEVSEDGGRFVEIAAPAPTATRLPGDGGQGRDTTRYVRSYDLAGSGLSRVRFIRIVGLGEGYRHDGLGFELDAIGAIHLASAAAE